MEKINLADFASLPSLDADVITEIDNGKNPDIPITVLRKAAKIIVEDIAQESGRRIDRNLAFSAIRYVFADFYYPNVHLPADIEKAYDLLDRFGLTMWFPSDKFSIFEQFVENEIEEYEVKHSLDEETRQNAAEAIKALKNIGQSILNMIDRIDPNTIIRFVSPSIENIAKKIEKTIPNLKK